MVSYGDAGMSVMEMSHRSSYFDDILQAAKNLYRELMNVPDNYEILFYKVVHQLSLPWCH